MMFRLLTWIDTFDLAASLPRRMGQFGEAVDGVRTLPVRSQNDEGRWVRHVNPEKWPELTIVRHRIGELGEKLTDDIEFGRIFFEVLEPGAMEPWLRGGHWAEPVDGRHDRLHLAIRTNPGATMFCASSDGGQIVSPTPGQLVLLPRLPVSMVNLGETARISLVLDVRRKIDG